MPAFVDAPFELKEIKQAESDTGATVARFRGYAATFGNRDRVGDIIHAGAVKGAMQEPIPLLWQHRMDNPIGIVAEWDQDKKGMLITGEINLDTSRGKDTFGLMRAGHVKHMSIGFIPTDFKDKDDVRHIYELEIVEVSLVTLPANPKATVTNIESKADAFAWQLSVQTGIPFHEAKNMVSSELKADAPLAPSKPEARAEIDLGAALAELKAIIK